MSDKDLPKKWLKEKARIKRIGLPWRERLNLEPWHLTWRFKLATHDDHSRGSVAEANVDWAYMRATLTFWLVETKPLSDDELEEVIVHELSHVLVNFMRHKRNVCTQVEERLCTELSRAFLETRKGALDEGHARARREKFNESLTVRMPALGSLTDLFDTLGDTGTELTAEHLKAARDRLFDYSDTEKGAEVRFQENPPRVLMNEEEKAEAALRMARAAYDAWVAGGRVGPNPDTLRLDERRTEVIYTDNACDLPKEAPCGGLTGDAAEEWVETETSFDFVIREPASCGYVVAGKPCILPVNHHGLDHFFNVAGVRTAFGHELPSDTCEQQPL